MDAGEAFDELFKAAEEYKTNTITFSNFLDELERIILATRNDARQYYAER